MYEPLLQELGLSKNEARIYEALLREGRASVGEIASKSKVHRRNVYDCIGRLLERGLVFEVPGQKDSIYESANPAELVRLLDQNRAQLERELVELRSLQRGKHRSHRVSIYRGAEGWKNYMRDMIRIGSDGYFIGAKGGWLDSRVKNFFPMFLREMTKRRLKFFHLFDHGVKKQVQEIIPHVGKSYRFLPAANSTESAVDIFGDNVYIIPDIHLGGLGEEIQIIVVGNRDVASTFRTWFDLMWSHCSPTGRSKRVKPSR